MHCNLRSKLSPENVQGTSPAIVGVLGVLLGADFTNPGFDDIQLGLQGAVFLQTATDVPQHIFIGALSDVQADLMRVAARAGLTPREFRDLETLFSLRTQGMRLYH